MSDDIKIANDGQAEFQVWWIPQIPGKPFEVSVESWSAGKTLEDVLARYDAFQFENNIKGDYCNAGGTQWRQHASVLGFRYCEPVPPKSRRRCRCGCGGRATHQGRVNGISLITACQLQVTRWVRDPQAAFATRRRQRPNDGERG